MKILLLAILGGVVVLPARAEDSFFRILAPSRESRKLLVIHAEPTDDGLQLRTVHKVNITFGGRSIARNRAGTRFFISGKANSIGENWAIVDFDEAKRTWKRPRTFTMPRDYSYLSLDREERFLLACNYGEGVVDVFRLREDGAREELAASLQEGRKSAHCVLVSPDNRFLYIPYVKENNALYQYSFDAASGEVKPLD
ncbi:MAG: beta-propeller fold lactonase family protein, partial [Akkermansiaceae bacterium]|nr:beta-propeller fold lactonase family protein [Akkermansiaceae bacterium]